MPQPPNTSKPSRVSYETRIVLQAVLCAMPGVVVAFYFIALSDATWETWVTALAFMFIPFPFLAWKLQTWITNPLKVAANILGSIREGDFTLRSRRVAETSGTIVELYQEINDIASIMEKSRIGGIETRTAIDKITENIDVATLIVDSNRKVAQANESARRLIASIAKWEISPIDRTVDELQIGFCLDASSSDFSHFSFRNGEQRFEGRRGIFRMDGKRYDLILLTDITKAANQQERESWKRLLRVLGHELNNSIAPINSLANTLSKMTRNTEMEEEDKTDILDGLDAISSRSKSIIGFMQDYTQLARLPEPKIEKVNLGPALKKACQLYGETITLSLNENNLTVSADSGQLDQVLINLIKNACEATANQPSSVTCHLRKEGNHATISIIDTGPGITNTDNLFVPFYTTKEKGSGIGLAISKQIVEAVGGTLTLANRTDAQGCIAKVQLGLAP